MAVAGTPVFGCGWNSCPWLWLELLFLLEASLGYNANLTINEHCGRGGPLGHRREGWLDRIGCSGWLLFGHRRLSSGRANRVGTVYRLVA